MENIFHSRMSWTANNKEVANPILVNGNHSLFHISFLDFACGNEKIYSRKTDHIALVLDFALNQDYYNGSELIKENTYISYPPDEQTIAIETDKNKSLLLFSIGITQEFLTLLVSPLKNRGVLSSGMMKILLETTANFRKEWTVNPASLMGIKLLLAIAGSAEEENSKPCAISYQDAKKLYECIEQFKTAIEEQPDTRKIVKNSGLNPHRFKKGCKELYGAGISQITAQIKMGKSLRMLLSETHSLEQISHLCGYSSRSNFITAFKGAFGITPDALHGSFRS